MQSNSRPFRVVVVVNTANSTHREMLVGILRYAKRKDNWLLTVNMGREDDSLVKPLTAANFDGAIGNFHASNHRALLKSISIPTVFLHPDLSRPCLPKKISACHYLYADNIAIAERAAEYFLARGFRSFAYIGMPKEMRWAEERRLTFTSHLAREGYICAVNPDERHLESWLRRLPNGTAVFAANDNRARHILELCQKLGIAVPEHLAILGVDNDESICEMSTPTLSSIALTCAEAGYRAAEALDAMLNSKRDQNESLPVLTYSVAAVISRGSTDTSTAKDALVRRAMAMIDACGGVGLTGAELARRLAVSRRSLEVHFRNDSNLSPYEAIQCARLKRVTALASETTHTLAEIADRCGFVNASHLASFYRRHTGQTLSFLRKQVIQRKGR